MNPKGNTFELTDVEKTFDPVEYLKYYRKPGTPENRYADFRLQKLHEIFADLYPSESPGLPVPIKVLDYGCGPVVSFVISAAGIANVSEIVLADYTSQNREALKLWLRNDPSAFDWSPYFKYVVQNLEGKPDSDVIAREERLRSLVKVASCDITADASIEKGYEGLYDVVMSFVCIGSVCKSESDYFSVIKKLSHLVKPGGSLLLFDKFASVSQPTYCTVGSQDFYYFVLSPDAIKSALEAASFTNVMSTQTSMAEIIAGVNPSEYSSIDTHWYTDTFYYMFLRATKSI